VGIGALLCVASLAPAQEWDLGADASDFLSKETGGKLQLNLEWRFRYESRTGTDYGLSPGVATGLMRTRLGLTFTPWSWLRLSGMVQDSRAPGYGTPAPNSIRDPADLQEGYIQLFPDEGHPFGMTVGRQMLNYGEGRLIGTPQWSNLARTYDEARVYYRRRRYRLELLLVSPVTILIGEFNRPDLGQRVWGTYNSFPNLFGGTLLEAYALRHDQNRPGGYTGGSQALGTDRIAINTFGFRLRGPFWRQVTYSIESAVQTGKAGPATQRAWAWYSSLFRHWTLASRPLDASIEYKYASGTANPLDPTRSSTFDQLFPANHDKFGHMDLLGWRNIHNARSLVTYGVWKNAALNFMYDNSWLASSRDALYNSSGKAVARSITGTAGRHIGQETDLFATYRYRCLTFGAGYGYMFAGGFIRNATPGLSPTYAYIFQTYTH
jgi:hypothetical protein